MINRQHNFSFQFFFIQTSFVNTRSVRTEHGLNGRQRVEVKRHVSDHYRNQKMLPRKDMVDVQVFQRHVIGKKLKTRTSKAVAVSCSKLLTN